MLVLLARGFQAEKERPRPMRGISLRGSSFVRLSIIRAVRRCHRRDMDDRRDPRTPVGREAPGPPQAALSSGWRELLSVRCRRGGYRSVPTLARLLRPNRAAHLARAANFDVMMVSSLRLAIHIAHGTASAWPT